MANICLGCLNPLPEGDAVCRICGFSAATQNPAIALPVETVLQEHYVVGRAVHESSDSLSYLGYDKTLKEPCVIQEYYVGGLCERLPDGRLTALGGCELPFLEQKTQFSTLMRTLARMRDLPCIVPIYDIFEENGTVYAVSDYVVGETLTRKLDMAGGRIPWADARALFMPLLTCAEQLAAAGIQHLAIYPDNILISSEGKPHLRGFSVAAARRVGTDLAPRLATGYAAPEQYTPDGAIGESADVYALAATIFRTVTGNEPPAGNNRAVDSNDLFMAADIAEELSQQVCVALFNALLVAPEQRTATVSALHQQLSMEPNVSALLDEDASAQKSAKKTNRWWIPLAVFAAVAVVALVVVLVLLGSLLDNSGDEDDSSKPGMSQTTTTTQDVPGTTPSSTGPTETQYVVPDLVGKNYYTEVDGKPMTGNFTVKVVGSEISDKDKDTVLRQTPEAGSFAPGGTEITVVISQGKDNTSPLINMVNQPMNYAKETFETLGYKVEIKELLVSNVAYGMVERTEPAPGEPISRGDTVTLYVSIVPETTTSTTEPSDEQTDPSDEQTDPSDGETDPSDEQTDPSDGETDSDGEDVTGPSRDEETDPT